jgi:hypothetical protein
VAAPDLLHRVVLILMAVVAAVPEIQLVQLECLQEPAYLVKVLLVVLLQVV